MPFDAGNANDPLFLMLIGMPGSRKSTFARKFMQDHGHTRPIVYLSTDHLIDMKAMELGKTYNEVFQDYIGEATRIMGAHMRDAFRLNHDIILDQTNLNASSRAKKLDQVPTRYRIEAVVFPLHLVDRQAWVNGLSNEDRKGKTIPQHVLDNMQRSFQYPSVKEEDFDRVHCFDYNQGEVLLDHVL